MRGAWIVVAYLVGVGMAAPAFTSEPEVALSVEVSGARPGVGQMMVSLFNSKETYMKDPVAGQAAPVDQSGRSTISFGELPAGEYAISVFYDEDNDGELDTGLFGIPTEKFGFSNNARGWAGPARWAKARFVLSPENSTISISLIRANKN